MAKSGVKYGKVFGEQGGNSQNVREGMLVWAGKCRADGYTWEVVGKSGSPVTRLLEYRRCVNVIDIETSRTLVGECNAGVKIA